MQPTPKKIGRKRLLIRASAVVATVVALWLISSWIAVYSLTHRFGPPQTEPTPSISWGTLTELRLSTSDGERLGAWHIDGRPDRPLVLILHGNGRNRSACLQDAEMVATTGCPVMLMTFRAHGDSTGTVNDFGYSGRKDVIAAVDWLTERYPGRKVVVWGKSLGAAAALFASPDLGDRVSGYLLECPYQDLRTATRNRTRMYLPPVIEAIAYAGLTITAPAVLNDPDAISPLKATAQVPPSARVLILTGDADRRARPTEAYTLAAALGDRAEVVSFKGGDHLQLAASDPAKYRDVVTGFLGR
jgi:fermentation-respiration switch protein FrsA (DUF1100 family)